MKHFNCIKLVQPIGEYYLGSIKAKDIVNNIDILRRKDNEDYVQRDDNQDRIKSIAKYCKDPDLTFPTPLIIAVNSGMVTINENNSRIDYEDNATIGQIIDGQHRILGIRLAIKEGYTEGDFDLPVIFMFDLEPWERAYVFSTVNHNQKQVPSSLIYDLFSLISMKYRSPTATCHVLAKTFNSDEKSPYVRKLKMLGKKTSEEQLLSQGTFVKYLLKYLISKDPQEDEIRLKKASPLEQNPNLPLREYFIANEDEDIYQILLNYFRGFQKVYSDEWDTSLLTRSIGFGAMIRILVPILKIAYEENDLREEFFESIIQKFKQAGVNFDITTQTSGGLETELYNKMYKCLPGK